MAAIVTEFASEARSTRDFNRIPVVRLSAARHPNAANRQSCWVRKL